MLRNEEPSSGRYSKVNPAEMSLIVRHTSSHNTAQAISFPQAVAVWPCEGALAHHSDLEIHLLARAYCAPVKGNAQSRRTQIPMSITFTKLVNNFYARLPKPGRCWSSWRAYHRCDSKAPSVSEGKGVRCLVFPVIWEQSFTALRNFRRAEVSRPRPDNPLARGLLGRFMKT